ncbi:cGMP-specific 3',5'-cyclic phosphodiesterase [Eumeta japonica]|uniref:cGMP-specific 3',5'-cyclic phosphodiesterase n=1 Tax=Eumeta variegata TaxID=151549 RepID=A0A4C1TUC1_EUMVA|nr:cGMP-specific 3',5'-cyclic phosphodiesterase [Eumeta japonica]
MDEDKLNSRKITEKKDELPQMQVGFIDMICLPLYKVLSETFPWIQPLYTGTLENRQRWQDLAEKVEMGLTWIDHDTIDKPIEEFTASSEVIKDVELTVTTLNWCHEKNAETSDVVFKPTKSYSLRRGKTNNLSTRSARKKLTRSLYATPSAQRDEKDKDKDKNTTRKTTSIISDTRSNETASVEDKEPSEGKSGHKHKGRLCHML